MSDKIATREAVFKVADKLFAKGTIVTQEKIRKELGGGSYNTIGKHLKEWKEKEDKNVLAKSYPMPDGINKVYDEIKELHWNAYCQRVELINDNEKITELEKENELLRDKLEVYKQDSIRLEQLEKIRKEENERHEKAMTQQRTDAAKIQELEDIIYQITK